MLKRTLPFMIVIVLFMLVLSACNYPAIGVETSPAEDPIMTAAAQTVQAQLTQAANPLATLQPPVVTSTLAPTQPAQTQPTPGTSATATQRPTVAPTSSGTAIPCNRAEFVSDISYEDDSQVPTGATFIKIWRLKNTGTCTWDSGYSLVFFDNNQMGGPDSQKLTTGKVAPGETLDVSVSLRAPSNTGSYEGDWKLRDASNHLFGIGADAGSPFWVKIDVVQGERVTMETGRTAVIVDGHVNKNGREIFIVNALAKQYMMVTLNTPNKPIYLEIQAPDGSSLSEGEPTSWQGTLPEDGDYLVSVVTTGAATDFGFTVTIPVRVVFSSGATSASEDGTVGPDEVLTFLLRASKNQTMQVDITSPHDDVFLTIYGLEDGTPYVRSATGQTSYSFKLPSTQDYVIECVSTGNTTEKITVDFVVK